MEKELIALFEKADGDKNKQLSKGKCNFPRTILVGFYFISK